MPLTLPEGLMLNKYEVRQKLSKINKASYRRNDEIQSLIDVAAKEYDSDIAKVQDQCAHPETVYGAFADDPKFCAICQKEL